MTDRTPTQNPLRTFRHMRGMTLAEVSARARVDIGQLSRVERGKAGLSVDALARVAAALGFHELERMLAPFVSKEPTARSSRAVK